MLVKEYYSLFKFLHSKGSNDRTCSRTKKESTSNIIKINHW